MYLAPWQIFLVGCIVGIFISLIVLITLIMRNIGNIMVSKSPMPEDKESTADNSSADKSVTDLIAKLSFILLNRGCISQSDVDFMMEHISFEEWKQSIEDEISELEQAKDEED